MNTMKKPNALATKLRLIPPLRLGRLATYIFAIMGVLWPGVISGVMAAEKPNILWIVAEDIGCDFGCYGTKGVSTPNVDRLAAEGVFFKRAYTAAPICAPSRSSFMTGLYPHQVFSHNMRVPEPMKKPLPEGVDIFTKYIRDAGYSIGLCGRPKKDWGFLNPKQSPYDRDFDWENLNEELPFFCQYQFYDTHRINGRRPDGTPMPFAICSEKPVDRSVIELEPYTPDTPVAREELGAYLENVNLLDIKIGKLLDELKASGLYEKTIIIVMGDNGPPLMRGKGMLFERGLRMPLIVRFPEGYDPGIQRGTVNHELVSALDMAPTFIDMVGGQAPKYLEGRIIWGKNKQPEPKYLFAMRDRHNTVDRVRSVCSVKHKYIRNFMPGTPYSEHILNNVESVKAGAVLFKQGKLTAVQALFYQPKPAEELYDLEVDPLELNNLADNPKHNEVIKTMRKEMDSWIQRTRDDGVLEDPELLKKYAAEFEESKNERKKK
jgi:arylsulfatase A-like enzyme